MRATPSWSASSSARWPRWSACWPCWRGWRWWPAAACRRMSHGPLRFGLAQLLRHRFDSTLQLGAFTLALFLVALLALVRSDLIAGWRQQLPPQAPNYFLVNIAPASAGSGGRVPVAASPQGLRALPHGARPPGQQERHAHRRHPAAGSARQQHPAARTQPHLDRHPARQQRRAGRALAWRAAASPKSRSNPAWPSGSILPSATRSASRSATRRSPRASPASAA